MSAKAISWAKQLAKGWFASVLFIGWSAFCVAIGAALANISLIAVVRALGVNLADYL